VFIQKVSVLMSLCTRRPQNENHLPTKFMEILFYVTGSLCNQGNFKFWPSSRKNDYFFDMYTFIYIIYIYILLLLYTCIYITIME
jgi:hypothetical protein